MSRAMDIAFWLICFSFGINVLHDINVCYRYGYATTESLLGASLCPDEAGTGHPFIDFEVPTMWGYTFKNADNVEVNPNDPAQYSAELNKLTNYNPSPTSVSNIFWVFSWIIIAIRFIVNTLFTPLFGVSAMLERFWIPKFVTYMIGAILFFIQIIGGYEFLTGKEVFKKG